MSLERDDAAPTVAMPPSSTREHGRFLPGVVLASRYRIVALAGQGGMGEVYRADDVKIGQAVALKFLPADLEGDPERLQRLLGEVRIARQVSHPNVCRVYDVDEFEGRHFITMEYVDGEDLAALLRRIGRLPQEKAIDLAQQLAAGLAAAHVQGIVHRDLKPANIMLDGRGRARITDFGLAAAAQSVRGGEALAGTPAYMAPEQKSGGAITTRTDVYALGLVMFEMLTGRRPREAAEKPDSRPSGESSARPSTLLPGLDPAMDTAVVRCLEPDPARRPASAIEVLAALPGGDPLEAAIRAGETPSPEMVAAAGEEGTLSPGKTWALFGATVFAIAGAIVLVAAVGGLDHIPMPHTPDALRERAGDIARQLGDDVTPRSVEWWLNLDDGYVEWSFAMGRASSLTTAHPAALRFNYRQSPGSLTPSTGYIVHRLEPAPALSGEAYVQLDPRGRLLSFWRLAPQRATGDSASSRAVRWEPFLALTGLDPGHLRQAQPLWTPDVACDARAAWVGDDQGTPVRIEAAAWRGEPVWLRTIAPWSQAERDVATHPIWYTGFMFFVGLVIALVVAFGFLARHNIRLGRGDLKGALRVGVAVFTFFGLNTVFLFRWTSDPVAIWRWLVRQPYFPALMAWLFYVGIEPYLRRRWPHRLVAWTRLLDGRFHDPLVGRELLIGLLIAAAIAAANCLPGLLERGHDVELLVVSLPLARGADFWGMVANAIGEGFMRGLGLFAMVLVLRVVFRLDALAWVATGIVMMLISLPSVTPSPAQWAAIAITVVCLIMVARVGVLATVAAAGLSELLACAPLTLEVSRWYAWRTGVITALLLAVALWGFRAMMGRRRILSAAMFDA